MFVVFLLHHDVTVGLGVGPGFLLRSAHLTKPAFLFQSVGKLISEGAPPRRRGGAGGTHASPPSGVPSGRAPKDRIPSFYVDWGAAQIVVGRGLVGSQNFEEKPDWPPTKKTPHY